MTTRGPECDHLAGLASEVGRRLRERREGLGMSIRQAAADAEVSSGHLSDIETGRSNASLAVLLRLARALSLPLAELLPRLGGHRVHQDHLGETPERERTISHPDLLLDVSSVNLPAGGQHTMSVRDAEDVFIYVRAGTVAIVVDGLEHHVLGDGDAMDVEQSSRIEITAKTAGRLVVCRGSHRITR